MYHGANGDSILSSGEDSSLRIFSTVSETLNVSLGRASYNRKVSKKISEFFLQTFVILFKFVFFPR
jgi:U3 small nucleolar RNA-associated protein 21